MMDKRGHRKDGKTFSDFQKDSQDENAGPDLYLYLGIGLPVLLFIIFLLNYWFGAEVVAIGMSLMVAWALLKLVGH